MVNQSFKAVLRKHLSLWLALLCGLISLGVYLRALAPNIVFGDTPELSVASYQLGVAHPTGYPFYTLLGNLFQHLVKIGSIAYRMNLFSALVGAMTTSLLFLLLLRVTHSRVASAFAALLFAFTPTFWSQAVIAEVYALHLLFVVATLFCLLRWDRRGEKNWLRGAAFVYGLSFTHHITTALLLPGLLAFALTSRHKKQLLGELRWTLPLFLAPLLLYLYLPWAAYHDAPWNWGDVRSWDQFLAHVTGRHSPEFQGAGSWKRVWHNVVEYGGWPVEDVNPGYAMTQYSPSLLWLAPWGLYGLFRRQRRFLALTLLVYLTNMAWAFNHRLPNGEVFYLPAHLMVALWMGDGLRQGAYTLLRFWKRIRVPRKSQRRLQATLALAACGVPFTLVAMNWTTMDKHKERKAIAFGHALLGSLKPNALLICTGETWVFPAIYTHYVEKRRPDVLILPVQDAIRPSNTRLMTRLAAHGLTVRLPEAYSQASTQQFDYRLLANVIADNQPKRPVYLVGPGMAQLAQFPELRGVISRLSPIAGQEPVFEVVIKRETVSR